MQAVYNIAEICARHGITDVVLSPGSRSAPLTLAFVRHPAFKGRVKVVPDERAAAFIGLGIAQATRRPVVLVCTSGTAGLNYAPAVAEAFFQQIPLLILTADRPPEWIDQLDGQTIRQQNLYGRHAKAAFDFPADTTHPDAKWHSERMINEAINLTQAFPAGPVQVNVPLREPFYPKAGEEIGYEKDVNIIQEGSYVPRLVRGNDILDLRRDLGQFERILVVAGQHVADGNLRFKLAGFQQRTRAVVVADVISNLPPLNEASHTAIVRHHDQILAGLTPVLAERLRPDLLITFGQSLISKSLKQLLRQNPPREHWHIQLHGDAPDTFRQLSRIIRLDPTDFFHETDRPQGQRGPDDYAKTWQRLEQKAEKALAAVLRAAPYTELSAFAKVLKRLTAPPMALHVANSMAVRYLNLLGLPEPRLGTSHLQYTEVFANRGTSGIDGCTSTALGAALAQPARPVVLLTGDVAFFYDRNAFWHNYPVPNLRVVLFNNHGGGIFRIIDGPRQQPELDEFFETHQALTAENTARDFNLRYFPVSSFAELDAALPVFFASETGAAILEIFTDSKTNAAFFEEYRVAVKQAFSA